MDHQNDEDHDHFDDDHAARRALEHGSGGFLPNGEFPTNLGNSETAQIVRSARGASKEEFHASLKAEYQSKGTNIYLNKRIQPRKREVYEDQARRDRNIITAADLNFINPRDIKKDEFVNFYSAVSFANHEGYTLNAFVTVCWELLGIKTKTDSREESAYYSKLIKPLSSWLQERDIPVRWVYSNEYSIKSRFHTHYLIHIPKSYCDEFNIYLKKLFIKINQAWEYNQNSVDIQIDHRMDLTKQWTLFRYICKGIDRHAKIKGNNNNEAWIYDLIDIKYQNPGNIKHIKRIGICDRLNKLNRKSNSYESLLERGYLDINLLYPKIMTYIRYPIQPSIHISQLFST